MGGEIVDNDQQQQKRVNEQQEPNCSWPHQNQLSSSAPTQNESVAFSVSSQWRFTADENFYALMVGFSTL